MTEQQLCSKGGLHIWVYDKCARRIADGYKRCVKCGKTTSPYKLAIRSGGKQ